MQQLWLQWVVNALLGPVFETVTTGLLLIRANLPPLALVAMYSHGILSIVFSKVASPDFARLIDVEQTAEGTFCHRHSSTQSEHQQEAGTSFQLHPT